MGSVEKQFRKMFGAGVEQYKDTSLTNAQLEALFTTPITLVAAPFTGSLLIFCGALVRCPANLDAQTVPGNAELAISYTNAVGLKVGQAETTGFLDQVTEQVRWINAYRAASAISSITPVTASPLVLHALDSNYSAGVAILHVRTFYRVLPTAF